VLGVEVDEEFAAMKTNARVLAALAGALLVVGIAACGGDDADADDDAETETEGAASSESAPEVDEAATTAAPSPEEQAIAAYEAGWVAEFEALNPPNPQHPALGEAFTGQAAQSIIDIVLETQNAGQYYVGSMETNPEVVSVTGSSVLLKDCTVEDSTTYDAVTDAVVEAGPYPPRSREVEVVNQDGTWRVSVIRTLEEPCTPG